MNSDRFQAEYKKLNQKQKEAVDTIEGPVMVIAGPGTGKTKVLTMRIAKILNEGLSPADGILCLTFTNTGVRAMRENLIKIIGASASRVVISTFHSFASALIEEFYEELSLERPPKLLDEKDAVLLYDELLEGNRWKYLRPRSGGEHNFGDLKSLISLLRRERMSPDEFLKEIRAEIKNIENNPDSISSRGPTKGEMKAAEKEKLKNLAGRTTETARFYKMYEETKKERNFADYDDVLEYMVELVRKSPNVRDTIRERFLYILIDEHQDSSGVQNEFLSAVWADIERPNVFVVGDDRQLIYGFGGASDSHFKNFIGTFGGTKIVALTENYRSTQTILDVAGKLLESDLVKEPLTSTRKQSHPIRLIEAKYPRDEILAAGIEIKKKIEEGTSPNECALLVPKKAQVRAALAVFRDLGLPVARGNSASFFELPETQSLLQLFRVLASPYEPSFLADILLDSASGVPFLTAHKFLRLCGKKISLESFEKGEAAIKHLGETIQGFAKEVQKKDVYELIQYIGTELFFKKTKSHRLLLTEIEVVRTFLHLALDSMEKKRKLTLADFLAFLDRLESYGEDVSLAVFESDEGVSVSTLHGSKGLEFECVWIAHLDENSLMKGKHMGFTLPESIKGKIVKKDELTAKRELYVALTRAKNNSTLSHSVSGYSGGDLKLARIVADMPDGLFEKRSARETEKVIQSENLFSYVVSKPLAVSEDARKEIVAFVKKDCSEHSVSVTHLNNFFSCPWKWYFRNFIRLPEPETESLRFGNVVHTAIERIFKKNITSKKELTALVLKVLDELSVWNERERVRFAKDAVEILEHFVAEFLPKLGSARSEIKISSYRDPDVPNIEITGKIDLIQSLPDATSSVTDFKTGRVKTKREIEKMDDHGRMSDLLRQLAMYSYLLMHMKGEKSVSLSRLFFVEAEEGDKDRIYERQIRSEEISLLRKDIKDYGSLLVSGKWMDMPCNFKPYGRQKECEYCALARNLK